MNEVDKLLSVAENEIGYMEKRTNEFLYNKVANAGKNNYTKYAHNIDMLHLYNTPKNGYPWCDVFVDWCFIQAFGDKRATELLCGIYYGAGCGNSLNYYKEKGQFYNTPKRGDQIFFKNGTSIEHTGLVYAVANNMVYTIEGNTSDAKGVIANGGCVTKKSYTIGSSYIAGYGRPDYVQEIKDDDMKEEFEVAKIYKNGSTRENVFADTKLTVKTGSLNPWEECECLGIFEERYLVKYKVDGTSYFKCGFVEYNGGIN